MSLTHINEKNLPQMVDVGEKKDTTRVAIAQCKVILPDNIYKLINNNNELQSKKGPVFQTAIIAGTMGVKKTSELIPLCHNIPINGCKFNIEPAGNGEIIIECQANTSAKTGIEMEALTGATIAALTIYDMCKALSHDIIIGETKLIKKTGGKSDFLREK